MIFYFKKARFGIPLLMRDDGGMHLYFGNRRASPGPWIVWWFPWNWLALAAILIGGVLDLPRSIKRVRAHNAAARRRATEDGEGGA